MTDIAKLEKQLEQFQKDEKANYYAALNFHDRMINTPHKSDTYLDYHDDAMKIIRAYRRKYMKLY